MVKPRSPKAARTASANKRRRSACRGVPQAARRADSSSEAIKYFCYYVDSDGRQHFNFAQQIWLRPQVQMAVTSVRTAALETLAVNLLTLVTRERDLPAAVGVTSRRVMQLSELFCTECLLSAHADGWVIPRATVKAWLATHLPATPSRARPRSGS